jgi:hypothetical protein
VTVRLTGLPVASRGEDAHCIIGGASLACDGEGPSTSGRGSRAATADCEIVLFVSSLREALAEFGQRTLVVDAAIRDSLTP